MLFGNAAIHGILSEHDEPGDLAGRHTCRDGGEFSCGQAKELCAGGVGISVIRDEESVALLWAGQHIEILDFQADREAACEEEFLVRHAGGGDESGFCRITALELLGGRCEGSGPMCWCLLAFHDRIAEAEFAIEVVEIQAVAVRHPAGVHEIVLAGSDAVDGVLAAGDQDVRAEAAIHIDALGFLQKPDTHLEAEVLAGESAHGADIHRVQRVVVVEFLAGIDREGRVAPSIQEAQHIVVGDFLHEPDAA